MEYRKLDEKFFKNVIDVSHDEIFVCDKEGIALYCNKTFESNYGISRDEMIGKSAMYLVENGYSDQTPVPEVIKTRKEVSLFQTTVMGRKLIITATPHLDDEGEIEFIVENCRDITALEKIKEELMIREKEVERYKKEAEKIFLREKKIYFENFKSTKTKEIFETAKRVASTDVTTLIQGESGTGKTHIAKLIHDISGRKENSFININCSTIPDTLFESELFGYVSGAFTGAKLRGKAGLVELAEEGTLFLDEIGEIPFQLQAKLLGLIQDKKYIPVGGIKEKKANIRIIAATNLPLEKLVEEKNFREDLYYRLNVVNIKMPSLSERIDDIEILSEFFLEKYNLEYGFKKYLSENVYGIFKKHSWPGNIRELENLIQNLVIMTKSNKITTSDLPNSMIFENFDSEDIESVNFDEIISEYEESIVKRFYRNTGSSYKMASALNISQTKAMRLIKKYIR